MKHLFMLMAFASISFFVYSQEVKVNINNQDATITEECAYRINGICSSEDIGGVDVEIVFADGITWAIFTNYNEFPVSVLYELSRADGGDACARTYDSSDDRIKTKIDFHVRDGACGSMVLGVSGSKKLKLSQYTYPFSDETAISDFSCRYSIKGLIVRKLSK